MTQGGTTRAEDAQGTPTQSHTSLMILVYTQSHISLMILVYEGKDRGDGFGGLVDVLEQQA